MRVVSVRISAEAQVALLRQLELEGLAVPAAAIRTAITDVMWPGRLERFEYRGAQVWVDAAHNPAGARALRAFLDGIGWTDCALVFGAMQDKDVAAMLGELLPIAGLAICTTAPGARAASAEALADVARQLSPTADVQAIADPADALTRAAALRGRVVIAGSIFLIGPVRAILRES